MSPLQRRARTLDRFPSPRYALAWNSPKLRGRITFTQADAAAPRCRTAPRTCCATRFDFILPGATIRERAPPSYLRVCCHRVSHLSGLCSMLPNLNYGEKVAFFFGRTPINLPTGDFHSTLGLIRNDIATLSLGGPNSLAFPRAMCLIVAIDLLGKMRTGSDSNGGVGARFRGFVEFALDPATYGSNIGTRIYEFRNAASPLVPDAHRLDSRRAWWSYGILAVCTDRCPCGHMAHA
jgi:hypothetical protein